MSNTDFAVNLPYFRDYNNPEVNVDSNNMVVGQKFKLRVGVLAFNLWKTIPAGGSIIKLIFNKNLKVVDIEKTSYFDGQDNKLEVPYNEYFDWKITDAGIEGIQVGELFKDFAVTLQFDMEAVGAVSDDIITMRWDVTDEAIVNDFQTANNWSQLYYTIYSEPTPVVVPQPPDEEPTPIEKIPTPVDEEPIPIEIDDPSELLEPTPDPTPHPTPVNTPVPVVKKGFFRRLWEWFKSLF